MSKGTEDALGSLHEAVTRVLTEQVLHETDETVLNEDGEFVSTGSKVFDASPATISAAVKFLKDNKITCDVDTNDNMDRLRKALDKKVKRSSLPKPGAAALRVVGDE